MPRRIRKSALAALIAAVARVSADVVLPTAVTQDQLSMVDAAWVAAGFSAPLQGSQSLNVTLKSTALMSLAYENEIVPPGTALQAAQVAARPQIYLTPLADSGWTSTTQFVFILISAGPIGRKPVLQDYSHALSYNVQLTMPSPAAGVTANMSLPAATDAFLYTGPTPAIGSGPSRYAVIAAMQPAGFKMPSQYLVDTQPGRMFSGQKFFADTGLTPVAASWFTVQQGTSPSYATAIATVTALAAGATPIGAVPLPVPMPVANSTVAATPLPTLATTTLPVLNSPGGSSVLATSSGGALVVLPPGGSSSAVPWGAEPGLATPIVSAPLASGSSLSLVNGSLINASSGAAGPILPVALPRGLLAALVTVAIAAFGSVLLL